MPGPVADSPGRRLARNLLIASMIAETGEPDERAEAWVQDAMAKARKALRADPSERAA